MGVGPHLGGGGHIEVEVVLRGRAGAGLDTLVVQ